MRQNIGKDGDAAYQRREIKDQVRKKNMKEKKMKKVPERILRLENVHSIGVIGDPGCEGLGTYNMKVYAGALEESGKDDITLVAGDLVPIGSDHYYYLESL